MTVANETQEWSGAVPKPSAVLTLQVIGVLLILLGIAGLIVAAFAHSTSKTALELGASYSLGVGVFAVASGWARPMGMMLGIISLSFLTALFPVGTIPAAVVGFLVIKNRDHVRDYYSQKVRREVRRERRGRTA